jgi:chemotaxis protein CheC
MDDFSLDSDEIAILKEVASMGMGHASTALEQLLGSKVDIAIPDVEILTSTNVNQYFPESTVLMGVLIRVVGDLRATLTYLFDQKEVLSVVSLLNNTPINVVVSDELKVSTIKEAANIMTGSYLSALSSFADLTLIPSLPHMVLDNALSICDLSFFQEDNYVVLVKSTLSIVNIGSSIGGILIFAARKDDIKRLLDVIKKKYEIGVA